MSSTSENVDRLICLPEDVLSLILSLMPIRSAVKTSILSKRWRYTWMLLKKLEFDDHKRTIFDINTFSDNVDGLFALFVTSQLELFRLHFSHTWIRKSNVSKWINEAVRLKVLELDIQVMLLELPLSLFTCKTLTKLRLVMSCYEVGVLNILSPVILPCLKTLDIGVFSKPSLNAFKLIHGCPILESLCLQVTWRNDEEEYVFNIPTLKRLELRTMKCVSVINKVVLNVPNLEYLSVGGTLCSLFVMEDLSSLVEANVSYFGVRFDHLRGQLLNGISGVKSLSWSTSGDDDLELKAPLDSPVLKFPNLKHLELKGSSCSGWLSIFHFLESSFELENLCIEKPEEYCWIEPQSIPTCMLSKLKTMKFTKCDGLKWDLQFSKYMLGNSEVLKTLTIVTSKSLRMKEEMKLCARLLKFPRASTSCEIRYVGNRSRFTRN